MSSRLFALTSTGFMTPTAFYTRCATNPKVKPRLKKKAQMFVKNWSDLSVVGQNLLQDLGAGTVDFKEWRMHRRWMERQKLGLSIRYKFRESLLDQYRKAMEYARSLQDF